MFSFIVVLTHHLFDPVISLILSFFLHVGHRDPHPHYSHPAFSSCLLLGHRLSFSIPCRPVAHHCRLGFLKDPLDPAKYYFHLHGALLGTSASSSPCFSHYPILLLFMSSCTSNSSLHPPVGDFPQHGEL